MKLRFCYVVVRGEEEKSEKGEEKRLGRQMREKLGEDENVKGENGRESEYMRIFK